MLLQFHICSVIRLSFPDLAIFHILPHLLPICSEWLLRSTWVLPVGSISQESAAPRCVLCIPYINLSGCPQNIFSATVPAQYFSIPASYSRCHGLNFEANSCYIFSGFMWVSSVSQAYLKTKHRNWPRPLVSRPCQSTYSPIIRSLTSTFETVTK